MKTYLITGVAGFIGSAIARRLLSEGHKVVGIDNFLTGFKTNIPDGVEFFEIDIADESQLKRLPDVAFDAALHLAAQTSGEISFYEPKKDLLTNALGTLNLLQYCAEKGVTRFLYASSMAVYGNTEGGPISVSHAANPISYYGITKLAGEYYVRAFSDRLDTTSFRMFNVYGPGQNMENTKQGMVSIYLYYFMHHLSVTVKGSKDRFRDFVYIDDVVDAWTQAIDEPNTYGKVYNLGSGVKTTVGELLHLLAVEWGDQNYPVEYVEGTPKDTAGAQADITALAGDLHWQPKVNIEQGLAQFVGWVKKQNISK